MWKYLTQLRLVRYFLIYHPVSLYTETSIPWLTISCYNWEICTNVLETFITTSVLKLVSNCKTKRSWRSLTLDYVNGVGKDYTTSIDTLAARHSLMARQHNDMAYYTVLMRVTLSVQCDIYYMIFCHVSRSTRYMIFVPPPPQKKKKKKKNIH